MSLDGRPVPLVITTDELGHKYLFRISTHKAATSNPRDFEENVQYPPDNIRPGLRTLAKRHQALLNAINLSLMGIHSRSLPLKISLKPVCDDVQQSGSFHQ